jgi:formylglycine-generating enzyme required for sulfatase activity
VAEKSLEQKKTKETKKSQREARKGSMPTTRRSPLAWTHPLERGIPPTWASEWGEDRLHGPWCGFEVKGVVQRLRWIPPGVFWMGSPEDEEGRLPVEGPRHLVSIDSGFWMFDTPCTQALWEAVMGENPSRFKLADRPKEAADRPVETVSWGQCQEFLTALNSRLGRLELSLPSEAQWEYACRAGTETARYSENLDAIAWYYKNSGEETHPVAGKEPNSWGLYDMLGNVWEWCADVWVNDYTVKARASVDESASDHRVFRGGSWSDVARNVRAACRMHVGPAGQNGSLGFRCAEFRSGC